MLGLTGRCSQTHIPLRGPHPLMWDLTHPPLFGMHSYCTLDCSLASMQSVLGNRNQQVPLVTNNVIFVYGCESCVCKSRVSVRVCAITLITLCLVAH